MLTGKTIGELPLLPNINDEVLVPVESSGSTYHIPFSDIIHRPFASYIDTTTQSLSGSNTPTVISFNTVVIESGITLTDLTKIETPYYPDEMLIKRHCCSLAYGQFTQEEIINGTAWEILNRNAQ